MGVLVLERYYLGSILGPLVFGNSRIVYSIWHMVHMVHGARYMVYDIVYIYIYIYST